MMVENLLKILAKKKTDVLQKPVNIHLMTNFVGESISSVTCGISVVKQLGKRDFPCDVLLLNKYEKQEMFC